MLLAPSPSSARRVPGGHPDPVLVTQVRVRHPANEIPLDDGDLLRAGEPLALLGHETENSEGKGGLTYSCEDS